MKSRIRKITAIVITMAMAMTMLLPVVAHAGSVVNLNDSSINITEGDPAVYIDSAATVTSSAAFDDGYISINVTNSNSGDNFMLTSDANPNADGAISVSGGTVYLGDGSGTTAIGVVDGTQNGQNGQPLKINLSSPMANSGFENGSDGWTLSETEYPISGDSLSNPSFNASIYESGGNHYLHMDIYGITASYGTGHGPYAISSYFEASPGDTIAFDWKAARTSDYFDVYAYLVNDDTETTNQILYQRGTEISSWQTKEIYLSSSYLSSYSDSLKFVFVCGSYDATGGTVIGSTMDIDNIRVVKTYATASVVQSIIRQVKYQNTSDDPAATRTVTVQTCDENNATDSDTRNINITPINDAPVIGTNAGLSLNEDDSASITSSKLNEADPDDSGTECTYTITSNVSNGTLKKSGSALSVNDTFTQADINNNYITYEHDGSETTSDSFSFNLADGGEDGVSAASGTFAISVTPVNDAPAIDVNISLTVIEEASGLIGSSLLSSSDADNSINDLFYKVTSLPASGTLKKSGSALSISDTFTQADINNGYITYEHDGSETVNDSFEFCLSDGTANMDSTFNITVTPVNDAPAAGINTGITLSEGASAVITASELEEGDPDDSGTGCIYTITDNTDNGILKKSGVTLTVSDTFTQYDIDNDLLSYEQDGSETTSDAFSFDLSDGGEDGAGTYSGTFSIIIIPVNDAPIILDQTLNVDENAPANTVVGTVAVTDAENDSLRYEITNGNTDTAFSINEDNGKITVAGTVDYDTIQLYMLDVKVTEKNTVEKYSGTIVVTIDINNLHDVPFTPLTPNLCAGSDSGISDTDNITNDNTPGFEGAAGSAMGGSIIKVYADNTLIGQTTANTDGSWNVTANKMSDKTYDITVTSTDNGGDVSAVSNTLEVTVDTHAPLPDSAPYLASGGSTTDDRTPEIAGSNETYAKVSVYDGSNNLLGTVNADKKGSWSFTVSDADALNIGYQTFFYTLTDAAGNVSAKSPGLGISVNDTPTGADNNVVTEEDTAYIFGIDEWGYSDANDDTFVQLRIVNLPVYGSLQYYDTAQKIWADVYSGQALPVGNTKNLRFVPAENKNGIGYASFEFKVNDGMDDSKESYTLTIDVTPVNDVHKLVNIDGDTLDYLEDQGQAILDRGLNANVTDIDNMNYGGGYMSISITNGGTPAEDVLGIAAPGGAGVSLSNGINSKVTINGIVIGKIDSAYNGAGKMLKINLNSNATQQRVKKLLGMLAYENTNHKNPSIHSRTVNIALVDKDGLKAGGNITVNVQRTEKASVNTLPVKQGDITITSIVCGGNVTNDGLAKVTECGVVYSTKASFDPASGGTKVTGAWTSSNEF